MTRSGQRTGHGALPNFLYIGPDKAGSTWLADVLDAHPGVHVAPAKDVFFFDRYYDRGLDWYRHRIGDPAGAPVVAEVCHDYLFSPAAAERIAHDLPGVRLMVTLRRPGERAFSSYLHMRKHNLYTGTFEAALRDVDELIDHGRYTSHLRPYVERFGADRIRVALFDDLVDDPQGFADGLSDWLGIDRFALPGELRSASLPASRPRVAFVARNAKRAALGARALGLPGVVGRVKRAAVVQRSLYRRFGEDRPVAEPAVLRRVDAELAAEVRGLTDLVGIDVAGRWDLA
ncbi:MAG: sulfotransferase [Actinobacteria bacterium]|nr:sulfotransferase [Actinomycetota bacterium]